MTVSIADQLRHEACHLDLDSDLDHLSALLRTAAAELDRKATHSEDYPTEGMTLRQRIEHVGGVVAPNHTVQFGSPMAVLSMIVLYARDTRHLHQEVA